MPYFALWHVRLLHALLPWLGMLQIQWTIGDGYNTFAELDWVVKTGGNAFCKTHGGQSLWEVLEACASMLAGLRGSLMFHPMLSGQGYGLFFPLHNRMCTSLQRCW